MGGCMPAQLAKAASWSHARRRVSQGRLAESWLCQEIAKSTGHSVKQELLLWAGSGCRNRARGSWAWACSAAAWACRDQCLVEALTVAKAELGANLQMPWLGK